MWDNDIAEPNYHYPTIFRYCKEQYPEKKTAIFSSWQDNRTKLVGDNLPATGNIPVDRCYDGLELDTMNYLHDKQHRFMSDIDESVAKHASEYIQSNAPDLSWVYLEYTDDMGHMHGDSPEYYEAVALADKRVGYIWQAIQYRQQHFNEDWLIIVTTDHGRDAKNLNEQFRQPQASIVDIMPTIVRFMNITVPKEQLMEIDGVPFNGNLSAILPKAQYQNGKIQIQWQAVDKKGKMKIWLSTANQFKLGGRDVYESMQEMPIGNQQATIGVSNKPSAFYKIILEAPYNLLNQWIIVRNKKKQD